MVWYIIASSCGAKKTLDFQGAGTYTLEVGVNFSVEVSETLPSHMAKGSCV